MADPLPPPIDSPPPARPRRSLGKWLTLFGVWGAGLVSWALYVAAAIYLLSWIM